MKNILFIFWLTIESYTIYIDEHWTLYYIHGQIDRSYKKKMGHINNTQIILHYCVVYTVYTVLGTY